MSGRSRFAAVLLGLSLLAGCSEMGAGTSMEVDLANGLDEGKSDSVHGKRLDVVVTEDVDLQPGDAYRGTLDVEVIDDVIVEVTGPRFIVHAPADERLRFQVRETGTFDVFTDLMFVAGVAEEGGDFTQIEFHGSSSIFGIDRDITVNYFDLLEVDPGQEWVSFEWAGEIFTRPFVGAGGIPLDYSLFAFPESGWGDLTGSYDFEISVSK